MSSTSAGNIQARHVQWFGLVAFFALLWVPLGQTPFLVEHWMKVGVFFAPLLLLAMATGQAPEARWSIGDLPVASALLLVAYIAHQFEEHWIDAFGNPYAFYDTVNALLQGALGLDETEVLSREGIFVINTSLVWLVGALAIVRSDRHAFPALAMAAIALFNAVTHVLAAVATRSYNPGLVTSIVVFAPVCLLVYRRYYDGTPERRRRIAASLLWSVLAHVVMVGGTIAANAFGAIPERAYFVALVFWSIVPCFLFRDR
ncbi:MAG: HXXEE domain-containing protein [Myxococcota bacterium]